MRILYISGADHRFFGNLAILLGSFDAHNPLATFRVLDFGLATREQELLKQLGVWTPRPSSLDTAGHPWYLKAAAAEYLHDEEFDVVVWLDSDMVVRTELTEAVSQIVRKMDESEQVVACCLDAIGLSIRGFIDKFNQAGNDVTPFSNLVETHGVNPASTYVNSGFFIVRRREFLDRWHKVTSQSPVYFLFEQNAFNVIAYEAGTPRVLRTTEWNLHGEFLANLTLDSSTDPIRIIHATSSGQHHFEQDFELAANGKVWRTHLKLFAAEQLRNLQFQSLEQFVRKHLGAMTAGGFFS